ncbi:hypothetical protein BS78_06G244000 [Paspalum vaginatum]|nr:hypothetical protein BS78_06G244000 [Paspalum vaginatum]
MASHVLILLYLSLLPHLGTPATGVANMFGIGGNITDSDTLVSPSGSFTMGFFSPGTAVCWVANRDRPLNDTSGVLVLGDTGSLSLIDGGSGQVVWSSYSAAGTASSAVARLLESGNLVVSRDQNSSAVLWQSFDHPSNTLLPGMKTGKNLWTGDEWYLTSWRSANDPSPGPYWRGTETSGLPENVVWHGDVKKYRTGPWNGLWFNGVPEMPSYADMFAYQLTSSPGEITYGYRAKPGAPLSRIVVTEDGAIQRLVWDPSSRSWKTFYRAPRDVCDAYARCGAFGLCDVSAASTSFCGCARGFSPASPSAWRMREASGGCRRNVPLGCADGGTATDGFVVVRSVKLPDTRNVSVDAGIGLQECRARCLANCSCVAYAAAGIRGGGGAGSGCIIWTDDLVDIRYIDNGQDLYLRLAMSELEDDARTTRRISAAVIAAICVVCAVAAILVSLGFIICRNMRYKTWRRRARASRNNGVAHMEMEAEKPPNATAVVSIDLATIEKATRNFSKRNVIGEGAFGIVYEGQLPKDHPLGEGLPGARKIALKRLKLSSLPTRVLDDFTREVAVMSNCKLRHANLVRLLAYCDQGNERALVYEYMQNKSLDTYIFGKPSTRASLDWPRRLEIIHGIARGVWYLHEGSGENVIHRDLKPSNVLLDRSWKPKIADFGTAKLFHADQTGTQTVVVSPGYASPEYAKDGDMTLKCDVFSFGVVLLELVTGRRNSAQPSLLSHAWKLWEEHRIMDLLDPAVPRPLSDDHGLLSELRRCIHIGLLCVQWSPGYRPAMSAALAMLTSRTSQLDQPRRAVLHCGTRTPLLAGEATAGGGAIGQDPSTVVNFT